ncbi:hypothetical protein [Thermococcus waiotapuensis]|uniref:Uncharacterized protein n=1 Tax=Thermococcus waiotapuensis TaxID=90909 RepID=A0AAE4NUM1_9EURY|nr:hypothetical protein [Thermococcus waiotapuensis]MDV3104129.1 hypothetical protein [Thermococcus waiotapuensis]
MEEVTTPGVSEYGCSRSRELARKRGFDVADDSSIFYALLAIQSRVFFEGLGDVVRIHYYNGLLEGTACPEYKRRYKGSIEVPLVEFGDDVLRVLVSTWRNITSVLKKSGWKLTSTTEWTFMTYTWNSI